MDSGRDDSERVTKRRYRASLSMLSVRIAQPTKDALAEMVPDGHRSEFVDFALRAALERLAREQGTPSMPKSERIRRVSVTMDRLSDELRRIASEDD